MPGILADLADDLADSQFAKASFIGELYAPAGYLVLLISASGPKTLRLPLRATVWLPASRALMTLGPGVAHWGEPAAVATGFSSPTAADASWVYWT